MKRRGATPAEDRQLGLVEAGPITAVTQESDGWSVTVNGWSCFVKAERCPVAPPEVGDHFITYGQIGYPFHGQELRGTLLWYQTPEDEEAERLRRIAEQEQRDRDRFEQERARLDSDYASLPETFQQRIDKFRVTNADFRWQFESYEMMCCKDALRIASYCSVNRIATEFEGDEPTAAENVLAFQELPFEEQKKAGIDEGHSGNSFGFACRLAYLWVTDPGRVPQEHGALVPLVGCEQYGCPHPLAPASIESAGATHTPQGVDQ